MKISNARNDWFCMSFVPKEQNTPKSWFVFLQKFYKYLKAVEELIYCVFLLSCSEDFFKG